MRPAVRETRPVRVAAFAAIPVFYQVPLYRMLAADPRVDLTVFYGSSAGVRPYDPGYGGRPVTWDVDLLGGYRHEFLPGADEVEPRDGFLALRQRAVVSRVRLSFDAVWVHGYAQLFLWYAMAAAAATRTPVLVREEQTLLNSRDWPRRWVRSAVLHSLFPRVSGLYIGSNNRDFFVEYGVRPDRLFFVPYCVDNEALQEEARRLRPDRAALRARFGVHDDRPIVLFVGRLMDKKQPAVLLEAFRRVRAQLPCALVLVGDGPLGKDLRRAAQGVEDVIFAGFLNRSEIATAFAAADIFALSSCQETWGLAVNEAMNFSLPIVLSDKVGSGADLVRRGENGFIFPSGDVEALASALAAMVDDPALRERFGRRSLELVAGLTYQRAAEGVVAACEAAIERRLLAEVRS